MPFTQVISRRYNILCSEPETTSSLSRQMKEESAESSTRANVVSSCEDMLNEKKGERVEKQLRHKIGNIRGTAISTQYLMVHCASSLLLCPKSYNYIVCLPGTRRSGARFSSERLQSISKKDFSRI